MSNFLSVDVFKFENHFSKKSHLVSTQIIESKLNDIPKISIVIPTYKRADYLKIAIESALNQIDFDNYEIIIVDNNPERDCETEQMLKKINNYKISYYKNIENLGMYGNWNRCIELAKAEYLTILNDDDTLSEEYLKSVNEIISKNQKLDALVTGFQVIDANGERILEESSPKSQVSRIIALDLLFGNVNPGSLGILFSKKTLIDIGGYDETYFPSSDYMFLVKYLVNFENVFYSNELLANYRIAVNESKKITTLQGFIAIDKKIRNSFIAIYPKLKKWIELSLPIIELKQYKSLSEMSEEFSEMNLNQIIKINNSIGLNNKIAYNLLVLLRKLLRFRKKSVSYNAF